MLKKIRKLTTNNKTGDAYGITLDPHIANDSRYSNTKFRILAQGPNILLMSGAEPRR